MTPTPKNLDDPADKLFLKIWEVLKFLHIKSVVIPIEKHKNNLARGKALNRILNLLENNYVLQ